MKRKILVVEDDKDILMTLKELLEMEGFEADVAINGKEALNKLRAANDLPELIILDYSMPVMDAPAFKIEQENDSRIKHIPLILVTANAAPDHTKSKINARAFLRKPLDIEDFINTVKSCLPAFAAVLYALLKSILSGAGTLLT